MAFDFGNLEYDLVLSGASFEVDDGLETDVVLSLFTDKRATPDQLEAAGLPRNYHDRRGYWGDVFAEVAGDSWGSTLWLLRRYTQSTEALQLGQQWAAEALDWMLEDGLASEVNVPLPTWSGERMQLAIEIVRPDGTRWAGKWDAMTGERL